MAKGDKIYVVTAGEYSDYHICAVTTDKERAEFLKKWYWQKDDNVNIKEFTDGEPDIPEAFKADLVPIYVVICKEKGDIVCCDIGRYVERRKIPDPKFEFFREFSSKQEWFKSSLVADDKEHAIKITKDMRAKMLAERFGI